MIPWYYLVKISDTNDTIVYLLDIPGGILRDEVYSSDHPQYMNYGGIGYIVGHEITHGFDNNGAAYDKDGYLLDWWTEKSKKNFEEKYKCLIEQYGNYTIEEIGMKVCVFLHRDDILYKMHTHNNFEI